MHEKMNPLKSKGVLVEKDCSQFRSRSSKKYTINDHDYEDNTSKKTKYWDNCSQRVPNLVHIGGMTMLLQSPRKILHFKIRLLPLTILFLGFWAQKMFNLKILLLFKQREFVKLRRHHWRNLERMKMYHY